MEPNTSKDKGASSQDQPFVYKGYDDRARAIYKDSFEQPIIDSNYYQHNQHDHAGVPTVPPHLHHPGAADLKDPTDYSPNFFF